MRALVVVDMQWGIFNKSVKVYESERLIKHINQLIDHFHEHKQPVVFLRFTGEFLLMKGTKEWELLSEMHFVDGDTLIDKFRSDAFSEMQFIETLETLKVDHIYVTGVISHGCVQSTVYGALSANMPVTLISDAHSNFSKDPSFVIESVNYRVYNEQVELLSTSDVLLT
ncbi:cysteine hydrolase family protein [Fusibacter sp. 3D3]|uniref:cysteine hydrolase family protein n=1 Tax=Fusibacter sp. 3D3 TaxID=1048380 RepID=UPI000853ED4D|nr:cysteine hydrolase [Fusibacter sp. 3D3]GAU78707.1 isochorismatase [Fusibacter sp. 3D3]